jgi:tRNA (cmo5U34)-methyltransferase
MSHSVAGHLRIAIDSYDAIIRQFIPDYDAMLDQAVAAVTGAGRGGLVVDLGAGTAALSERVLAADAAVTVELLDADPAMLAQAEARLARFGTRARFRHGRFDDPLPRCRAMMASLALHHVPTLERKAALYRRIAAALEPGGVLVNADVMMPADPAAAAARYQQWADHLVRSGMSREEAFRRFAEWAGEDFYFPVEAELAALAGAGLEAACVWESVPGAVLAARRPPAAGRDRDA